MRLFWLERDVDETGVSGTGRVAQGVEFDDGWVSLRWLSERRSTAVYASLADVEAIHGHNGATTIVFEYEQTSAADFAGADVGYAVAGRDCSRVQDHDPHDWFDRTDGLTYRCEGQSSDGPETSVTCDCPQRPIHRQTCPLYPGNSMRVTKAAPLPDDQKWDHQ